MIQQRNLIAAFGLGALAVVALIAYLIWSGYREAVHLAETTTRNYAAMIEGRLDATFRRAEAHVTELARDLPIAALSQDAVPHHAAAIDSGLDLRRLNFPELVGLRVFDVNGDLIYASESKTTPRVNAAERDYFRIWRDRKMDAAFFSAPVISKITGRPVMLLARPLRGGNGVFRGVVTASIELVYFQKLFHSLDVGPHGAIGIFRSDNFTSVVRWPVPATWMPTECPT